MRAELRLSLFARPRVVGGLGPHPDRLCKAISQKAQNEDRAGNRGGRAFRPAAGIMQDAAESASRRVCVGPGAASKGLARLLRRHPTAEPIGQAKHVAAPAGDAIACAKRRDRFGEVRGKSPFR